MSQDLHTLDCLTIKIERQANGSSFVASSPDILELQTEGETLGETLHNLTAAYELVQEWYEQRDKLLAEAD